jgi:hypothetical protein
MKGNQAMKKMTRLAAILVALIMAVSLLTVFPAAEAYDASDMSNVYIASEAPATADTLISISTVIAAFGILGFVIFTGRKH